MTSFLTQHAPLIGIGCLLLMTGIAVTFFLLYRGQKRIAQDWKEIAFQREWECRQWRETNAVQRRRAVEMAKIIRDFDPRREQ